MTMEMNGLAFLPPMRIYMNPLLVDRYLKRRCRSRKRRIIKMWARDPKNWRSGPSPLIQALPDGSLVMHPEMARRLREVMARLKER
jgi:hypothetical protein